jgi:hypothetical protein
MAKEILAGDIERLVFGIFFVLPHLYLGLAKWV